MDVAGRSTGGGSTVLGFIRLGIAAGLFTCIIYPVLVFVPLPRLVAVSLAGLIGPVLGVASLGLREALNLHRRSVAADLGGLLNLLAGALFSAMLLVQLAVRQGPSAGVSAPRLVGVWLGLDVAWDVYIGLGTLCFSLAMLRHPRFGLPFAVPGLAIALALLVLNLSTFPAPPAESGLFDIGPLVGLWYLAVTIRLWASLAWAVRMSAAGG